MKNAYISTTSIIPNGIWNMYLFQTNMALQRHHTPSCNLVVWEWTYISEILLFHKNYNLCALQLKHSKVLIILGNHYFSNEMDLVSQNYYLKNFNKVWESKIMPLEYVVLLTDTVLERCTVVWPGDSLLIAFWTFVYSYGHLGYSGSTECGNCCSCMQMVCNHQLMLGCKGK